MGNNRLLVRPGSDASALERLDAMAAELGFTVTHQEGAIGRKPVTTRPGFSEKFPGIYEAIKKGDISLREGARRLGIGAATMIREIRTYDKEEIIMSSASEYSGDLQRIKSLAISSGNEERVITGKLPAGSILCDLAEDFQRTINPIRVKKMVSAFDPDALGSVEVWAQSDGTFHALDGQHRIKAIMGAPGYGAGHLTDCIVHLGISRARAAHLFETLNGNRKPLTANEMFAARLAQGKYPEVDIAAALARHGKIVSRRSQRTNGNEVGAASAILSAWKQLGASGADSLFDVVSQSYPGNPTAWQGFFLTGLAGFLSTYASHPNYSRSRLISVLSHISPVDIQVRVKALDRAGIGNAPSGGLNPITLVLLSEYNKHLRENNRLTLISDTERS